MSLNPYESPVQVGVDVALTDVSAPQNQADLLARESTLAKSVSILACFLPLINYGYTWVFWLLASASMGEWVRPYIHDPKDFAWGLPSLISGLLMMGSFTVLPIVVAIGFWRRKVTSHILTYVVCLLGSIYLFRLDIWQLTSWIAD